MYGVGGGAPYTTLISGLLFTHWLTDRCRTQGTMAITVGVVLQVWLDFFCVFLIMLVFCLFLYECHGHCLVFWPVWAPLSIHSAIRIPHWSTLLWNLLKEHLLLWEFESYGLNQYKTISVLLLLSWHNLNCSANNLETIYIDDTYEIVCRSSGAVPEVEWSFSSAPETLLCSASNEKAQH